MCNNSQTGTGTICKTTKLPDASRAGVATYIRSCRDKGQASRQCIKDFNATGLTWPTVRDRNAEADITAWVEYCIEGMAVAFENVLKRMEEAQNLGLRDQSPLLKKLDPRQRQILALFQEHEFITSKQVSALFGFKPRTGAALCEVWVEKGFLIIADPSNKGRKYRLSQEYQVLVV